MDWPGLIEDVRIELGLLHQLVEESADLIRAVKAKHPSRTDCLAAGCALQSLYNGVEKVFALIAERVDGGQQQSDNARQALLETMAHPTDKRSGVVDASMSAQLTRYLDFREAFRYAHFFHLKWEQTAPLVIDLPKTVAAFETQIDAFLTEAGGQDAALAGKHAAMPRYWSKPLKVKIQKLAIRPLLMLCLLSVIVGMFAGAAVMKSRLGDPAVTIPAAAICPKSLAGAEFVEPSGNVRKLSLRHQREPFIVVAGQLEESSEAPFTGGVARRAPEGEQLPALTLWFHDSHPVFFQAINEQGEYERGYFSSEKLLRYSLCDRTGLPYRTYHLTPEGKVTATIERGRCTAGSDAPPRDGWYYRFYQQGVPAGTFFIADDGQILRAETKPKRGNGRSDSE